MLDTPVAICIPTYNGGRGRLGSLLLNLRQRTPQDLPHRIIVCDDSGKPDHRNIVRMVCSQYNATYVENPFNKGVAASWNTLTRAAPECRYVIILNDDVLVDNGWLKPFAFAISQNQRAASFSLNCHFITESDVPTILSSPQATVVPLNVRRGDNGQLIRNERFATMPAPNDGPPGRVMCPGGQAFGFRREIYDMVGGFDERFLAFYEETMFGASCAERGYPSFTLSTPPNNYHLWSATFASAPERNWGQVMADSRRKFVEYWSARLGVHMNDAPDIHNLLMDRIPKFEVRYLDLSGTERKEIL